jgi:protein-disulfide isomerase
MSRVCALVGVALALGCAGGSDEASPRVAEAEGISITLAEVDAEARDRLFDEQTRGDANRIYQLRSEALEAMIGERVVAREAERRGLAPDELIAQESAAVTDAEIAAFFEEHRSRLREGTPLAAVQDSIRTHLEETRRGDAVRALVDAASVEVNLEPPRHAVAADGPALGPGEAPVTIVEFSDFECPYCRQAAPIVKELRKRYPEQIRVVYRHFPLESIHPRSRAAALASACAEDQGRFWEFHDKVFESPHALSDAELRSHAEALALELARYDECIRTNAHRARIDADIAAARGVGISGTPAFLVNGVLLTGAQPIEDFERVIRRELASVAKAP